MTQACPKRCGGSVHIYCTRVSKTGRVRFQYLRCRLCHAKPVPSYLLVPCSMDFGVCSTNLLESNQQRKKLAVQFDNASDDWSMNTTHADDFPELLSAWETAMFLGISVPQLMESEFHGLVPSPRKTNPVLWCADDLLAWTAKHSEGKCE